MDALTRTKLRRLTARVARLERQLLVLCAVVEPLVIDKLGTEAAELRPECRAAESRRACRRHGGEGSPTACTSWTEQRTIRNS